MRFRLFLAAAVVVAAIAGCSDDSNGPTSPQQTYLGGASLVVKISCEEQYLLDLSPVLAEWQDSLEARCGEGTLPDPPKYTGGMDPADYLADLSPLLAAWEDSLEACVDEEILDSPPKWDGETSVSEYLLELSPVLIQWKLALESAFEEEFLASPPVFTDDEAAPEISCPADTTVECAGDSTVVEYEVAAEDDCDPNPVMVCIPPSGSKFPLGETLVTCTAVDSAGNESQCEFTVTVGDTTPPMIDCPADTTIECAGPEGAVLEFDVTATDACDDTVTVVCVPKSGSTFPSGKTVVTCTAVDDFGNTSECTFTVTVADVTPPTVTCASDTTLECTGLGGAVLEFTATASDICDPEPVVECDPPSGSMFPLGETVVTCTARDAAGNEAQCSFTVTVQDTTPPTIENVRASPDELWPPNHKMVDVAIVADVTDLCQEPECWIDRVESNERINGKGDGNTEPDWDIVGNSLMVRLRAERSGRNAGRTYTIYVKCKDPSGNEVGTSVEVSVPHDRGKGRSSGF